jgi:hypothetical protein
MTERKNMSLKLKINKGDAITGEIHAVCTNYFDLGIQKEIYNQKEKELHKIILMFELEKRNKETGKRILVNKEYTLSSAKKSSLLKDLESWRGKPFTEGEEVSFDNLIGYNAILDIVENDKGYLVIQSIKPAIKDSIILKPEYGKNFCPDFISKKISQGRFENRDENIDPPF